MRARHFPDLFLYAVPRKELTTYPPSASRKIPTKYFRHITTGFLSLSLLISKYPANILSMPEFGNPFAGQKFDRKLTDAELIRAIRFMIAAEYEAIQLYQQLADSTDNKLAVDVLLDIADEERVHAGEFLRLLHELAPDEEKFYREGAGEVEEEIAKRKSV